MKARFSRNITATKNVCLSGASRMRLSGALSDTPVRSYASKTEQRTIWCVFS